MFDEVKKKKIESKTRHKNILYIKAEETCKICKCLVGKCYVMGRCVHGDHVIKDKGIRYLKEIYCLTHTHNTPVIVRSVIYVGGLACQ